MGNGLGEPLAEPDAEVRLAELLALLRVDVLSGVDAAGPPEEPDGTVGTEAVSDTDPDTGGVTSPLLEGMGTSVSAAEELKVASVVAALEENVVGL